MSVWTNYEAPHRHRHFYTASSLYIEYRETQLAPLCLPYEASTDIQRDIPALCDLDLGSYFRLCRSSLSCIWNRLDGRHTMQQTLFSYHNQIRSTKFYKSVFFPKIDYFDFYEIWSQFHWAWVKFGETLSWVISQTFQRFFSCVYGFVFSYFLFPRSLRYIVDMSRILEILVFFVVDFWGPQVWPDRQNNCNSFELIWTIFPTFFLLLCASGDEPPPAAETQRSNPFEMWNQHKSMLFMA